MLWLTAANLPAGPAASPIGAFRFHSGEEANAAWIRRNGSPAVKLAPFGGIVFPCPLKDNDRVYWDQVASLNLSLCTSFEMDLSCRQPEAMRSLGLYLKSGNGWYVWNRPLAYAGRQTVLMPKNLFATEGTPAGWHQVEAVRFSPWKGCGENTEVTVYGLYGRTDPILVLEGSHTDASEKTLARRASQRLSDWLGGLNLPHGILTGDEIPAQARILLLPYNPSLTANQRKSIAAFIARGGKLMVFYSADEELARMMNMKLGPYVAATNRGQWSALVFRNPKEWLVPERVAQQSWNIRPVTPLPGKGEIIAEWTDAAGRPTGDPAWVYTDRGLWMTHILLGDNPQKKQEMLLGLLGHLEPSLWARPAWMMLQRAGQIDSFRSLEEAAGVIGLSARENKKSAVVEPLLAETMQHYREAIELYEKNAYPAAFAACRETCDSLTRAYARAQAPAPDAFVGIWDQYVTGFYDGKWPETARLLKESGIKAVFPNVAKGGITRCRSAVLPMELKNGGDPFKDYLTAARDAGLEVHPWIICWNLDTAPEDFIAQMKKEGRLVVGADGKARHWLNPAHEANRQMLAEFIREVIRNYGPDGIHLDYIRYPDADGSYDTVSRMLFEKHLKTSVANWPRDVMEGGSLRKSWLKWRADNLTELISRLRDEIRSENPRVRFSAAVYGNWPECADSIGQDWGTWIESRLVDFACPMNYTSKPGVFHALLKKQMNLENAERRIYPGIGVSATESQLTPDLVIEQIGTARELKAPGYLLYQLDEVLMDDVLPVLRP